MKALRFASCLLIAAATNLTQMHAQTLPQSATPRGLVYALLMETARPNESVNRLAFAERLYGELAKIDPRSLKGMLSAHAQIHIDSIPDLPTTYDKRRHVVAYISVVDSDQRSNMYIFCSRDSIWRVDAIREFPTSRQRAQIAQSFDKLDTTNRLGRYMRADLTRVVLPDDSLAALLRSNIRDAELLANRLEEGQQWHQFGLRDNDFEHLDEYRELDDDLDPAEFIFYTLDRHAVERLKATLGVRMIARDPRYPGTILFVGASVQGDTYGYIYSPQPQSLPQISAKEFIMLKPIAHGWWLYKRVRTEGG